MTMKVLEKNLDKEADKLGIAIFQLDDVIRWAQVKSLAMQTYHAMGLGDYPLEYDGWDAYNDNIDVNFYINEDGVLKVLAYPVVDGVVDTSEDKEVLLISLQMLSEKQ